MKKYVLNFIVWEFENIENANYVTLAHKTKASHGASPVTPPWRGGGSIKKPKPTGVKSPSKPNIYGVIFNYLFFFHYCLITIISL